MEFKPEYYLVLETLAAGDKSAAEVARVVEMGPHDVEAVLTALMGFGLVERREKGLIFKREVYTLTDKGWEVLHVWRSQVKDALERAVELRRRGRVEEAEETLAPLGPILPMLLTLGLLDLSLYAAAVGGSPAQAAELEEAEEFDAGEEEF